MKRNSSCAPWSAAIVGFALACGGAGDAKAADPFKGTVNAYGGAAYNPWSGYAGGYGTGGYGTGGYGTGALGYAAPGYSTGMGGYTGGYGGGACCNGVWDGYCAEKRSWCECRVKHRRRPLGRGAGPCCPSHCGYCVNAPAAPVCHAATGRGFFHYHKPCVDCGGGAEQVIEETTLGGEPAEPVGEPTLKPVPDVED